MDISALDDAVRCLGSQNALANAIGIRSASISGWRKRSRVPYDRCKAIERATNGAVTRYDLRPDVFGPAPTAATREVG